MLVLTWLLSAGLRATPAIAAASALAAAVWVWQSRRDAIEEADALRAELQSARVVLAAERQRRADADRIATDLAARTRDVDAAVDSCLDEPLPAGLLER